MEFEKQEDAVFSPSSPGSQYVNSSALSLMVVVVVESQIPVDDLLIIQHLKDTIFHINPRFSSIMVLGEDGLKKWKRVDVEFEYHIKVPNLPKENSIEFYDEYMSEYMSKLAIEPLSENRPLWEIHFIKQKTSNADGTIIFKFHHALGDGYTIMGVVLSAVRRIDNPALPLTFPYGEAKPINQGNNNFLKNTPGYIKKFMYTLSDFGWGILRSKWIEDDVTPIRSGHEGVEFRPIIIKTVQFRLDDIKRIKKKLNVTINDVLTGIITMGTRMYMEDEVKKSRNANSTALVLLNTRNVLGYKSVSDMLKPKTNTPWGNHFAFLHFPFPELTNAERSTSPLNFILKAHQLIKKKRNSASVLLSAKLLDTLRRLKGPEVTAEYIHGTLKNSSMTITNMIGPVDQMELAGHPINGYYFFVAGPPQSLSVSIVSYMRNVRVAFAMEKDFIDPNKFQSCINKAFQIMYEEAFGTSPMRQ